MKWIRLTIGIAMILMTVLVIIPYLNTHMLTHKIDKIKTRNIDSGALIYSDSEQSLEGNYFMLLNNK